MPAALAIAIRYVIMAAVQLGLWTLLEKYGLPLIDKAIVATMEYWGIPEEQAKDIVANKIFKAFEEVGVFAATLKTKMPIKVAERLGFTSKGFVMRKITTVAGQTAEKAIVSATTKVAITQAEGDVIIKSIAQRIGSTVGVLGSAWKFLMQNVSATAVVVLAAANVMDFGNWQGAYQKTFEKIFTSLGFPPDSPMPKAKTLSDQTWKRIYATVEVLKPIGISYPFSGIDKAYSRSNLADLIDEIAANLVKNGTQATYKNVIALALPCIQLQGQADPTKLDSLIFDNITSTVQTQSQSVSVPTISKVFTGIVSQGVVGAGLSFTPRPDDLIESAEELRQAAANNLTPFLNTLLGKIVYEVKVVSSVVTKDGFKQTGTTQRIISGYNTNGTPKYKTVTNKFATLVVYALTDKGTRAKLTTIVLGPTNSAKLTVAQNDLRELETDLPALVTTTDINAITGIATTQPITVAPPTATQTITPPIETPQNVFYVNSDSHPILLNMLQENAVGTISSNGQNIVLRKINGKLYTTDGKLALPGTAAQIASNASMSDTAPAVGSGSTTGNKPGANATTLFEWYQAQGQELPSVSARSQIYAGFGLGQASYYTGSAEQNTKLLAALKAS